MQDNTGELKYPSGEVQIIKKSNILKNFMNIELQELVLAEVDIDFLQSRLLTAFSPEEVDKINKRLTALKNQKKDRIKILESCNKLLTAYEEEEKVLNKDKGIQVVTYDDIKKKEKNNG